jgi:hypothetical protein
MGASIHISGTGSSVVDTVFVSRSTGVVSRRTLARTVGEFAMIVIEDLDKLRLGGLKPTQGDTRCIIFGHLVRMTVWSLRTTWDIDLSVQRKLEVVAHHLASLPRLEALEVAVSAGKMPAVRYAINEGPVVYDAGTDEISF